MLQIRNNYDKEVFNGDSGVVEKVDLENCALSVRHDERVVEYDVTELDELVLAYATTIHKSQGSEYPIVVMPLLMTHYVMLQRNLVYTGVTRAKRVLIIVGTRKALAYAVRHVTVKDRNTLLKERLQRLCGGEPEADGGQTAARGDLHDAWLKRDLFERLAESRFRSRFHLNDAERRYAAKLGGEMLRTHAVELIGKRLVSAEIPNDGKQTPMRGHPVFVAQHATATCCRGCLEKWHGIPKGRALSENEQRYVVGILLRWIDMELKMIEIPAETTAGDGSEWKI